MIQAPSVRALILAVIASVAAFGVGYGVEASGAVAGAITAGCAFIAALLPVLFNTHPRKSDDEEVAFVGETRTLYVGNLPYRANEVAVRQLFQQHGRVVNVRLMKDRDTGKRKGYGFVEMAASDTEAAVAALNDAEFQQRTLKVREAKERREGELQE